MELHHMGVACRDMEVARQFIYATQEVTAESGPVYDERLQATVCLISTKSGLQVELVSGKRVDGLVRKGLSYYHVCYEVEDLSGALVRMQAANCLVVVPPTPATLFGMREVAFVYSPLGLIELLQK